jgi:hypothetical protein
MSQDKPFIFDACTAGGLVKANHGKCPQVIQGTPIRCDCACHTKQVLTAH